MPFNVQPHPLSGTVEAYRKDDSIHLVISEERFRLPLSTARTICDLLAITVYDESIVGLMAKRRRLAFENEQLKEKLHSAFQYCRRKATKEGRWKNSH